MTPHRVIPVSSNTFSTHCRVFPEMREHKINLIGVYIARRGKDLTIPRLDLLT